MVSQKEAGFRLRLEEHCLNLFYVFFSHWRKIWQITCGNLRNLTREEIELCLRSNRDSIITGILMYKTFFHESDIGAESGSSKGTSTQANKESPMSIEQAIQNRDDCKKFLNRMQACLVCM